MIIDLQKIPEDGMSLSGDEPASILGLEGDRFLRPSAPVHYDLTAQLASNQLILQGVLEAPIEVQCARCAEFFSTTLQDSSFLRAYEIQTGMDSLDVTEDVREGILLLVPNFPLCKPDCEGLCPQCGENLNLGACTCGQKQARGPWEQLNKINF